MSKYVKNLITDHLRDRLAHVEDALLVNVIGLDANANNRLRAELGSKNIHLMVVKNSLAARATADSSLGPMFDGLTGTAAICWGGEDIVSLAKVVASLADHDQYQAFEPRGGVMDGGRITPEQVVEVSKWPSRTEQLSLLLGQILAPATVLASQVTGPGAALASQVTQATEDEAGQQSSDG
jgi:large subunit ribosomal protein L10